ncbi:OLC1v1009145C1 [Oldenlandia corymbosa var. corymbosa]|uniref:OLC1v1009145C1 n=1 Tax=Oldenlandia corymbosa var. corymbosa TaxID=529605 RepID=A0AAV1DNC9_OLDCO|nr:OLC1v1009145C1 [Oldenlandia corymbosa var. corymbosa]
MLSNLPEDLLTEVLVRLSAESLWKLRRVSKSWRALIESKSFEKLHLIRGQSSPSQPDRALKLMFHGDGIGPIGSVHGFDDSSYVVAEFDSLAKLESTKVQIRLPCIRLRGRKCYTGQLRGSRNGLICVSYESFSPDGHELGVVLWNPSINSYWRLRDSPVSLDWNPENHTDVVTSYGFGYDEIRDDYKLGVSHEEPFLIRSVMPWGSHRSGVQVNHALHWILFEDGCDDEKVIVAFDLRTDKFHLVPLPPSCAQSSEDNWELGVLDGCLSFTRKSGERSSSCLWIMKEYGAKDSWTRFNFENESGCDSPCAGWGCITFGYTCEWSGNAGRKLFFIERCDYCDVKSYTQSVDEVDEEEDWKTKDKKKPFVIRTDICGRGCLYEGYIFSDSLVRPWSSRGVTQKRIPLVRRGYKFAPEDQEEESD